MILLSTPLSSHWSIPLITGIKVYTEGALKLTEVMLALAIPMHRNFALS
jgi:hypothetical protein